MLSQFLRRLMSLCWDSDRRTARPNRKSFRVESLESRSMLAGDLAVPLLSGVPDQIGVVRSGQFFLDDGDGQWEGTLQTDIRTRFGGGDDVAVAGDRNGDTLDEIGIFRDGRFYFDENSNGQWDGVARGDRVFQFGGRGDKPAVGDFNGDGTDDLGVYRRGRFLLDANGNGQWDGSTGGDKVIVFGLPTDLPVIGDWNGDGTEDVGVFRDGQFLLDANGNGKWDRVTGGDQRLAFGAQSDQPIAGDFDGNAGDEIGVRRGNRFYLDANGNGAWDGVQRGDKQQAFGSPRDQALVGNWNNQRQVINGVVQDLASRLGVSETEISVVSADWVERINLDFHTPPWVFHLWVARTPGWQIVLDHGGEQFEYQADKAGRFKLMADATQSRVESLVDLARADLTERLGAQADDISVVSVVGRVWPDGCLGLPGSYCTQVLTPGYRIALEHQPANSGTVGDIYYYRTSMSHVRFESQHISPFIFPIVDTPRVAAQQSASPTGTQFNMNFSNVSSTSSVGDGIQIGNTGGNSVLNIGSTTINGASGTGINIGNIQDGGPGTDLTANFGTTIIDALNGILVQDNNDTDTGTTVLSFNNLFVNAIGGVGLSVDDNSDGPFGATNATLNFLAGLANITATGGAAIEITGGNGQTNSTSGWVFQSVSSTGSSDNGVVLVALNNDFTVTGGTNINTPTGDGVVIQNVGTNITLNNTNISTAGNNAIQVGSFLGNLMLLGGTVDNHDGNNVIQIQNGANSANIVVTGFTINFGGIAGGQTAININSGDGNVEVSNILIDFNGIAGATGIFIQGNGSLSGLNLGDGVSVNSITLNPGAGTLNFNFNNGTEITGSIIVDGTTFNP